MGRKKSICRRGMTQVRFRAWEGEGAMLGLQSVAARF
jgi:hypothetical protein